MRRFWVAGLVLALAAGAVGFADVAPGELRSVQAKAGAALRKEPSPLAPLVATIPYGGRAAVREVRGAWARVTTTEGDGWMRGGDLVEPATLTGGGAFGARPGGGGAGAPGVSASEVSAAGRQFDEATQGDYVAANPNLRAAFAAVDKVEETKPSVEELEAFIVDGRLGR